MGCCANCNFASGTSQQPPNGKDGPFEWTVALISCGDLFENNIVSSLEGFGVVSTVVGGYFWVGLGSVLCNNVIWSTSPKDALVTGDISIGNLIPTGPRI